MSNPCKSVTTSDRKEEEKEKKVKYLGNSSKKTQSARSTYKGMSTANFQLPVLIHATTRNVPRTIAPSGTPVLSQRRYGNKVYPSKAVPQTYHFKEFKTFQKNKK
jgi:hypothetical protein